MNLNDLETFVRVAECGTFTGAAEQLGVPKSTVSRRVARLEEELGRALLSRSTRSFVLSDDGRALFERCGPALREIADVERDLADSEATPRGRLRLTASIDLGTASFMGELIAAYSLRYPDVGVSLGLTNRVVDLLEEGIDVGFRTHMRALPDRDDLVATRLGPVRVGAFASPSYLEQAGVPSAVEAVTEHRVVSHSHAYLASWPTVPALEADDYRPIASMLAAGAGIGVLPEFVAAPYLATGALERVLGDWQVEPATLSLVWLRSRHLAPRVRAFIDLARERWAQGLGV